MTMPATTAMATRRVATYARVSSEDQAERGTIATQVDELERRLVATDGVVVAAHYADDGVSGTIALEVDALAGLGARRGPSSVPHP